MQMLMESKVIRADNGAWWKVVSKWFFEKRFSECNKLVSSCVLVQFWKEISNLWNISPSFAAAKVSFNYIANTVIGIQKILLIPYWLRRWMSAQLSPFAFFFFVLFYTFFSCRTHRGRWGRGRYTDSKQPANPLQRAIKAAFTKPFSFSVPHFWWTFFFPLNSFGLHVNLLTFVCFRVSRRLFL